MANKKISQLNQLNVSDVDISTDVVAIVDSSTNTTKKVSVADLITSNLSATDKNYVHNQIASSASWVVNHNLNKSYQHQKKTISMLKISKLKELKILKLVLSIPNYHG